MTTSYGFDAMGNEHEYRDWVDWFFETIDLGTGLKKMTAAVRTVDTGTHSYAHAFAALIGVAFFGLITWTFDIATSWAAMDQLRVVVTPSLGGFAYTTFALALLTYAPTAIELLGTKYARFDMFWWKAAVIGFTAFDLATDLPGVQAFLNPYYAAFAERGVLAIASFYLLFLFWWILSSFVASYLLVLSVYATFAFVMRGMLGDPPADDEGPAVNRPQRGDRNPNRR